MRRIGLLLCIEASAAQALPIGGTSMRLLKYPILPTTVPLGDRVDKSTASYATFLNDKKLIQIYNEAIYERHGHHAAA